jgi:quercetin dioxygenase-like cupin family protein
LLFSQLADIPITLNIIVSITQGEKTMPMSINSAAGNASAAYTLDAGAGDTHSAAGVTITLKTSGHQSAGQIVVLEYSAPARFQGPPSHWHKVTTEFFYVLQGEITVTTGSVSTTLKPGGYAFVPSGVVHGFSNLSDKPARFLVVASPAGLDRYIRELEVMLNQEQQWPPREMGRVVELMARYDTFAPGAA